MQDDLGAVAEGMSLGAKACTFRLPTSVFGQCNPEDRKPGVMVFGVLGCSAWGREEGPWPPAGRSGPRSPGGSCQYYAVQQYSVVRRVWGRGGVGGFLIFRGPTPSRNLTDVILPTPVPYIPAQNKWPSYLSKCASTKGQQYDNATS